ncbi:MAG: hypothetical protein H6R14_327 [Proteobacteria bacterium]|nr:hypothetical protein [Pseudomonadota bacterium]
MAVNGLFFVGWGIVNLRKLSEIGLPEDYDVVCTVYWFSRD